MERFAINLFFLNIYLFICLHWVLAAAHGIFSCSRRPLSCSVWDLAPWPRIEPGSPALGAWSLSHWTTREVLLSIYLIDIGLFRFSISSWLYFGKLCFSRNLSIHLNIHICLHKVIHNIISFLILLCVCVCSLFSYSVLLGFFFFFPRKQILAIRIYSI